MTSSLWKKSGKLVVDGAGKLILCDHCPCQVQCAGCSLFNTSSTAVVDLGAGGWTAGLCGGAECANVKGLYALTTFSISGGAAPNCVWSFHDMLECGASLGIQLVLGQNDSTHWGLVLEVDVSLPGFGGGVTMCRWVSSPLIYASNCAALLALLAAPQTITKQQETISNAAVCNLGSMPATVQVISITP
jgi:hypothetical protein